MLQTGHHCNNMCQVSEVHGKRQKMSEHSFIHSFTRLFPHSLAHTDSFTHSIIHSLTHAFIHSCILSFIHSFIRAFIYSLTQRICIFPQGLTYTVLSGSLREILFWQLLHVQQSTFIWSCYTTRKHPQESKTMENAKTVVGHLAVTLLV